MYKNNNTLHYSPTDLTVFMESPFASWMNRLVLEHPERAPEKDAADVLTSALAQKGYDHEAALEAEFVSQGLSAVTVGGSSNAEKRAQTQAAMASGVDVIVQALLEASPVRYSESRSEVDQGNGSQARAGQRVKHSPTQSPGSERFLGYSDFLVRVPGGSALGGCQQVSKLQFALGEQARVGSVDKFQGQEAPIVFLSLCASNPAESPRGLDFLFDRQRLTKHAKFSIQSAIAQLWHLDGDE